MFDSPILNCLVALGLVWLFGSGLILVCFLYGCVSYSDESKSRES